MRIIPFFTSILGLSTISRSSSLPLSNRFEVSAADQTTTGLALPFLPNTCLNPAYAPLNLTEGREISKIEEQSTDGIIGKGIIGTLTIGCLARMLEQGIRRRNNELNDSRNFIPETIISLVIDASLVWGIGIEEFLAMAERSAIASVIPISITAIFQIIANQDRYSQAELILSAVIWGILLSTLWGIFIEKGTIGGFFTEFAFLLAKVIQIETIANLKKIKPKEKPLELIKRLPQAYQKVEAAKIKEKEAAKENKEAAREELELAKNELAAAEKQAVEMILVMRKVFASITPEQQLQIRRTLPESVKELLAKGESIIQEQETLSSDVKNILDQGLKTATTIQNLAARICAICTEHFKPDQSVFDHTKNTKHLFHPECMEAWIKEQLLNQNPPSCPCCREPLQSNL